MDTLSKSGTTPWREAEGKKIKKKTQGQTARLEQSGAPRDIRGAK
jgi:hypothetical protein